MIQKIVQTNTTQRIYKTYLQTNIHISWQTVRNKYTHVHVPLYNKVYKAQFVPAISTCCFIKPFYVLAFPMIGTHWKRKYKNVLLKHKVEKTDRNGQ